MFSSLGFCAFLTEAALVDALRETASMDSTEWKKEAKPSEEPQKDDKKEIQMKTTELPSKESMEETAAPHFVVEPESQMMPKGLCL